ncbi:MAG: putative hydrolase or acyltransferase of alpha/beta superfamily [Actinomycetia bacterium]|nr:putative hydrolase or acyltransferase of alpha/beta superfamily [Actinomycetes bacterium]
MPRLVLVPGFTQTASSWREVVTALGPSVDARAIDVPVAESFAATAAAVGEAGGRAVYCGYSMGGRLCLRLAIDRPDLVAGLVLVSSTAGIQDTSEQAARMASDEELAQFVEREGVDAFLERWLAQPLFAGVPPDAPGLSDRRQLSSAFVAHCLRQLGVGTMDPMWARLEDLHMPVGVVWGEADAKYQALGQLMARAVANSIPCEVRRSGHAIHLEQPHALASALETVLAYMRD